MGRGAGTGKRQAAVVAGIALVDLTHAGWLGRGTVEPRQCVFLTIVVLNVLALNACWNFMHTAVHKKMKNNPFWCVQKRS